MKYAKRRNPAKIGVSFYFRFDGKEYTVHLVPGHPVYFNSFRYTDEGYTSQACSLTLNRFDYQIDYETRSDGRDCDGRMSSYGFYTCKRHNRAKHKAWCNYGEKPKRFRYPEWTLVDCEQRDYSAEVMGY